LSFSAKNGVGFNRCVRYKSAPHPINPAAASITSSSSRSENRQNDRGSAGTCSIPLIVASAKVVGSLWINLRSQNGLVYRWPTNRSPDACDDLDGHQAARGKITTNLRLMLPQRRQCFQTSSLARIVGPCASRAAIGTPIESRRP